jgi:hypothetical protein
MRRDLPALLVVFALVGACNRSSPDLGELKDAACACKTNACARDVGVKLSKVVLDGELGDRRAKLALEAANCLAAFGQ